MGKYERMEKRVKLIVREIQRMRWVCRDRAYHEGAGDEGLHKATEELRILLRCKDR